MPYIPPLDRRVAKPYDYRGDAVNFAGHAGRLNYGITVLCNDYLAETGLSYSTINEVIGALECAKLELYRRVAVPYEDNKLAINGDVYDVSVAGA